MAHYMTPENARRFWAAYKNLKFTEGQQTAFASRVPYNQRGQFFWNQYGQVGRNKRMAAHQVFRNIVSKYHLVPYYDRESRTALSLARNLEPMYGFSGLINKVRHARTLNRRNVSAAESVRHGMNRWRMKAQTKLAERILQRLIQQRMRNIEYKIKLVRKANATNRNNRIRNARLAINNSMLNANVKSNYTRNLNNASK